MTKIEQSFQLNDPVVLPNIKMEGHVRGVRIQAGELEYLVQVSRTTSAWFGANEIKRHEANDASKET